VKRAGFILTDVQSNVLLSSHMHITTCPIDQQLHFRPSYLKANKVSKSKQTRKVEHT